MVNNTVNGDVQESEIRNATKKKKKFKPAGQRNTPKVVAVEIRQEVKEQLKSLKTGGYVAIPSLKIEPLNLQAGEFVSIKAYDGNKEQTMNKAKATRKAIEGNEK